MNRIQLCFFSYSMLFAALGVSQGVIPVGGEFQVNSYTTSNQRRPAVSPDGSGGFVVVWQGYGIQAQRFTASGNPVGSEFPLGDGSFPRVTSLGSSGFVVVFEDNDANLSGIHGLRFASDGSQVGSQFQINSYTSMAQKYPTVSSDAGGGFVVVWSSEGSSGSDTEDTSIQGQRFDSNGSTLGGEFQVNTSTTSYQRLPSVNHDGSGAFVVVWESNSSSGTDQSLSSIQGQRFQSDGNPLGDEFQVNTYTPSFQNQVAVAGDGVGGFLVVWESLGSPDSDTLGSIRAQHYDSNGAPSGSEFQVNSYTTDFQDRPEITSFGPDGFVITWFSDGSSGTDSSELSVQGQRFASDASPIGSEFQVNSFTENYQYFPQIGSNGDAGFVIVWESEGSNGTDSSGNSVQAQRYVLPIFADGFESGDTSSWSGVFP